MAIRLTHKDLSYMIREAVRETLAYHGSKADFDKFDVSKVKTGYGACRYGKGIYVTIDKNAAIGYATGQTGNIRTPDGYLYDIEIPDYDGHNYVMWDKPIGKDLAEKINDYSSYPIDLSDTINENTTGEDLFNIFGKRFGDYLQDVPGLVGAQIPSTGQYHELINYLIFDGDDIKIINKQHID